MEASCFELENHFAEEKVAHLLGLTPAEYREVEHTGIRVIKDSNGNVLSYYLTISPLNTEAILCKLKTDKRRTIYILPDCL